MMMALIGHLRRNKESENGKLAHTDWRRSIALVCTATVPEDCPSSPRLISSKKTQLLYVNITMGERRQTPIPYLVYNSSQLRSRLETDPDSAKALTPASLTPPRPCFRLSIVAANSGEQKMKA
jgi:hypothetical protein